MMIRAVVLYWCLITGGFSCLAQGGFRTRYYPPGSNTSATKDIFEISPGKYIAGGLVEVNSPGGLINKLIIAGLDSAGNILWEKKYGKGDFEYLDNPFTSRFFYKHGNFLYAACSVLENFNKYSGVLIKFDMNGDTVWQKVYRDDSLDVIPQMVTHSVDGGFLITGFFQSWTGGGQPCMLIKTDGLGNELWRKKINKAGHNVSDGRAIVQDTATGKIIIAGYQYVGSSSSAIIKDHILITDSIGNKLLQKSYYSTNEGILMDLIQTKDKNIVVVGLAYKNLYWGSNQLQCSFIMKIDINSTQITPPLWFNFDFDSPEVNNSFSCIKELPSGELHVGGHIDTLSFVQKWFLIRMSKFKATGEWVKSWYYNYKTNDPNQSNSQVLKSFNLTSDGGWVAGIGQVNFPNPNPLLYLKYDSTGCDSSASYCLNPVDLTEFFLNSHLYEDLKIKVFPNPTGSFVLISSEEAINGTIEVSDLTGRIMLSKNIRESNKIQISLEELKDGVYIIRIRDINSGIVYKEKLVKQE